jgi:predicted TPR repeat methyltransferase
MEEQHACGCGYDVMAAADVLVYIGDLSPLFVAAARAANEGCVFAFLTEKAVDTAGVGENAYKVTLTGRFQHSLEYVKRVWLMVGLCSRIGKPLSAATEVSR